VKKTESDSAASFFICFSSHHIKPNTEQPTNLRTFNWRAYPCMMSSP
jgi:hypothetical protein